MTSIYIKILTIIVNWIITAQNPAVNRYLTFIVKICMETALDFRKAYTVVIDSKESMRKRKGLLDI